jgi:predicted glycoside hydrolase/deacetylase ChbG (UPF0249 family)
MASRLFLHADDFGMSRAATDGILRGFRDGLLTSTSLLANAPDADRAIAEWKKLLEDSATGRLPSTESRRRLEVFSPTLKPFDLGVHLNLTQGRPLGDDYPAELLDAEGRFPGVFSLFARLQKAGRKLLPAVRDQWRVQLQFMVDRGAAPTHLNGHQYVEMLPGAAEYVAELMKEFNIRTVRAAREPALFRTTVLHRFQAAKWPLSVVKRFFAARFCQFVDSRHTPHPAAYFGTAHAGRIDLELLRLFLQCGRKYPSVEVAFHPAEAVEKTSPEEEAAGWRDPLASQRPLELAVLVSLELPAMLEASGWRLGRLNASEE